MATSFLSDRAPAMCLSGRAYELRKHRAVTPRLESDLHAIAAFLLSLPPIKHAVPERLDPGTQPTGSFLTFPAPSAWDAPREAAGEKK